MITKQDRKKQSPLTDMHARLLLQHAPFVMNADFYREFGWLGMSRGDIRKAVDHLVKSGKVKLGFDGGVKVKAIDEALQEEAQYAEQQ